MIPKPNAHLFNHGKPNVTLSYSSFCGMMNGVTTWTFVSVEVAISASQSTGVSIASAGNCFAQRVLCLCTPVIPTIRFRQVSVFITLTILMFAQKWTGSSFAALSLKRLGLRVQLGHPIGEECLLPQRAFNDDFTLIHTNGIHEIGLDYCGCDTAHTHTTQLLRVAWFPATTSKPRTAATFQILEQYHLLSFESKASGYEFYHAIARLTDNTGLHPHKVCDILLIIF